MPVIRRELVDRPPVAVHTVPPIYPPPALRARIRGIVTLDVLVSEAGTPLEVRVIQGARAGLTEAAVEAVQRWRFRPATKDGMPVRTWTTVQIPFEAIPYPQATTNPPPAPTPPPTTTPTNAPPPLSPRVAGGSVPPPWPPEPPLLVPPGEPASVYRTRRAIRLAVLPDQARIFIDGRYVGIAADWDDRAGGEPYEFELRGPHRVRAELPGYQPVDVEVDVIQAAETALVAVTDHLTETTRKAFTRLPAPALRTRGLVRLRVDPPDASISVNGKDLGLASAFSGDTPLRLPGPAVNELHFSAPGRGSKDVRVLVSYGARAGTPLLGLQLP